MKFSKNIEPFITDYVRQIEEENAVLRLKFSLDKERLAQKSLYIS
ncbi:MAG: hypothetical protein ABI378_09355 [Chitinophagaceae bacterium]